ncbi:MAG: YggS family pyridoxal phosphate-dependent enzyme [Candidatus Caenarcaniphilales bacterium]|nr:YggS family pyridoxal phosphate-dependent enzyme [Candidatus Caenarcaniphilales bacterium]
MKLAQKIAEIKEQIHVKVKVVAVSKYVDSSVIREAYALGLRDFGESRIQDAKQKKEELQDLKDLNWHLVGHLQTNKVKEAIKIFDWIHSVDSLRLAKLINEETKVCKNEKGFHPPKLLLQVKLADDSSPASFGKFGFAVPELLEALPEISKLENLQMKGLMTILPRGLPSDENFRLFSALADLQKQIQEKNFSNISLDELSMGMSGDYLEAIRAGSTMLRVGRFLFT